MYLYYVTATEKPKPRKPEKEDVHALIAQNDEALLEQCKKNFIKFEPYTSKHKLNKNWN